MSRKRPGRGATLPVDGEAAAGRPDRPRLTQASAGLRTVPLFWRIFAANAVVLLVATLVLVFSPATVSAPPTAAEVLVLVIGLVAMLVVNLVLVRASLRPLERLRSLMQRIDLLQPGERLPKEGRGEIAEVVTTFNSMLDRLEDERRASAGRVLAGQESERRRIARELHDEIGQRITVVLLHLKRISEHAPPELEEEVQEAQETARSCLDDLGRIARQLRPSVLDDLGLASALSALANSFTELTGVSVARRLAPGLPALSETTELALYRVAQESLTNVARHAQASRVRLELEPIEGAVELRIADDGRGLDGAVDGGGIRGMRERAMLAGGELFVGAGPEGGAQVVVRVPADQGR